MKLVNGTPVLVYQRRIEVTYNHDTAYLVVAQPLPDADPTFAFGSVTDPSVYCALAGAVGDDGAAANVIPNQGTAGYFGWSPWCAATSLSLRGLTVSDLGVAPTGGVQFFALSKGRMFFELLAPNTVAPWDPVTNKVTHPTANGAPIPLGWPMSAPDGAIAFEGGGRQGIGLVRIDGSYSRLVTPTASKFVSFMALDRSANQLVWAESTDGGPSGLSNTIIWTSPYDSDPARIKATTVAALADPSGRGGARMVANKGVVLNTFGDTSALLTRLSDGMGWMINAEPGEGFVYPLWVDDDEVWLSTAKGPGQRNFRAVQSGMLRVKRSTLGAPTVARGL